jgi:hypothetical protein
VPVPEFGDGAREGHDCRGADVPGKKRWHLAPEATRGCADP